MESYIIIPKGTLLYRSSPICNKEKRYCKETRKTGVYFSTYMLMSLAMCIEYQKSMNLAIYEVKKDIKCVVGKYTHLDMPPVGFTDINILGVTLPLIKKRIRPNINHFDKDILPIIDLKFSWMSQLSKKDLGITNNDGEVFITDDEDLKNIILKEKYYIPLEGLLDVIQKCNYQASCKDYYSHLRPYSE